MHTPLSLNLRQWSSIGVVTHSLTQDSRKYWPLSDTVWLANHLPAEDNSVVLKIASKASSTLPNKVLPHPQQLPGLILLLLQCVSHASHLP